MNTRVNQKLYCARLVLDAASTGDDATKTALLEAALFHLTTAYRCYLYEIIDDQLLAAPGSAQDALRQREQLDLAGKPELNELAKLERSGDWLQQMLDAYATISASTEPDRRPSAGIALADITAHVDIDSCQHWLQQFQQLLQRQREHAREW
jgi:hypothetical protein